MAAFAQVTQPDRRDDAWRTARPLLSSPGDKPLARSRSFAALVAGEIIPRLLMAHGGAATPLPTGVRDPSLSLDVDAFVPLTLAADPDELHTHVERLRSGGVPVEVLMVDLLAPAARLLGTWWEEDRCDFVEVTMGLWRLQEVLRGLSAHAGTGSRERGRTAIFAPFPGEQHDFGAAMVSEHFRNHGWEAELLVAAEMPELLAWVARIDCDLVGLTISCDAHRASLPSAIRALRSVSRNSRLRVLIGGRVVNEDPALAQRSGADGTASDARAALALADELVGQAGRPAVHA